MDRVGRAERRGIGLVAPLQRHSHGYQRFMVYGTRRVHAIVIRSIFFVCVIATKLNSLLHRNKRYKDLIVPFDGQLGLDLEILPLMIHRGVIIVNLLSAQIFGIVSHMRISEVAISTLECNSHRPDDIVDGRLI